MTTTLVPLGTPFTETLRQLAFNHALNETRTEKFTRYVDYTGYKTGIKFSFRPHQLVDFKSDLTEMTLTTASKKWDPCGKSNVSTFCQSVGENKRRELIRKFMREHKLEVSATNMGRLLLATGEKVRSTRDWDNDPDEDSASILENLPSGGIGRFQFKAKFAAMDLDEIRKRLTPEEAEIARAMKKNESALSYFGASMSHVCGSMCVNSFTVFPFTHFFAARAFPVVLVGTTFQRLTLSN